MHFKIIQTENLVLMQQEIKSQVLFDKIKLKNCLKINWKKKKIIKQINKR